MAFSLHNHCLCRVANVLGRVRIPRTLDGPQMYATWLGCSSRAVFPSVFSLVAFWQKRSRDHPETAPDRGTDQQNRRSTAELEQHCTASHVCLRRNLPNICCLLKQRLNCRQASRHCQNTLSKCSWHEPRAARLTEPHPVTVSFLCRRLSYIQNVTRIEQKLHHSACSCPRRLPVWGRLKFTKHSLTLQVKLCIFSFESATAC